nr:hypothetical protein [uncultured Blautia sp.]
MDLPKCSGKMDWTKGYIFAIIQRITDVREMTSMKAEKTEEGYRE